MYSLVKKGVILLQCTDLGSSCLLDHVFRFCFGLVLVVCFGFFFLLVCLGFFAQGQLMWGYTVKNITEIIPQKVEEKTKDYSMAL